MQHPELLWYLIAVVVIGTVAVSLAMDRANSGEHVWSPGAAYPAPAGDPMTVTRHAWRPDVDGDTIRVADLAARIAHERRPGRHALIDDPPAVDDGVGVGHEPTQQLPSLFEIAA